MPHRIFLLGSSHKRAPKLAPSCVIAEATDSIPLLWLALLDFDERRTIPVTLRQRALKNLCQRTEWLSKHYSDSTQLTECSTRLGRTIDELDWKYVTLNVDDMDCLTEGKFGPSVSRALKSLGAPNRRSLRQLAKVASEEIFHSAVHDEGLIGYSPAFKPKKQRSKRANWKNAPTPRGWQAHKKSARIEYIRNAGDNSWDEFEQSLASAWLDFIRHVEREPGEWKYIFFICQPETGSISILVAESEPARGRLPSGQRFIFRINSKLLAAEYQLVPEFSGLGYKYDSALKKLGKKVLASIKNAAKETETKSKIKELRKARDCKMCFAIKAKKHYPAITMTSRF